MTEFSQGQLQAGRVLELELGDTANFQYMTVMRIPGGWLYHSNSGEVAYVPFSEAVGDVEVQKLSRRLVEEKRRRVSD